MSKESQKLMQAWSKRLRKLKTLDCQTGKYEAQRKELSHIRSDDPQSKFCILRFEKQQGKYWSKEKESMFEQLANELGFDTRVNSSN